MKDAVLETAKILHRTLKLPGLWQRITHRDFIFLHLCMCVRLILATFDLKQTEAKGRKCI